MIFQKNGGYPVTEWKNIFLNFDFFEDVPYPITQFSSAGSLQLDEINKMRVTAKSKRVENMSEKITC